MPRDVPWLGDRRRSKPRAHTLSVDFETSSYDEWKSKALDAHLDVCVDSIAGWRYLAEAVADTKHAKVYGARARDDDCGRIVPVAVVWRRGNDYCSLYESKRWDEDASEEAVQSQQACCDLLGVGTHPSPGALGAESMLKFLDKNHPAPAANVARLLRDHIVGGRAELRRPVVRDECYEIDRSMAYCAEAAKGLPTGRAVMLPEGTPQEVIESYATWFCACTVVILKPLKLGPFPIRDAYGNISFPTKPGNYITWLWAEEAADCRAAGCVVDVGGGIGYRSLEPVLAEWARFMFRKRGEAATKRVADKVKQVAVAAVGRMAMGTVKWTIVQSYRRDDADIGAGSPSGNALSGDATGACQRADVSGCEGGSSRQGGGWDARSRTDCPASVASPPGQGADLHLRIEPLTDGNGSPLGYYAIGTEDHSQARMPQWASYIWMQARRTLYARQLAEVAARNRVLWSNFDSLGLARPSRIGVSASELGAWREAILTHVVVTQSRGLICDQRVTLPGCHGEARERAIAYAVAIRQAHEREREKPRPLPKGYYVVDHDTGEMVWDEGTPHAGFQEGWRAMANGASPIVGKDGSDNSGDSEADLGGCDRLGDSGPVGTLSIGGRRLGGPRRRPMG